MFYEVPYRDKAFFWQKTHFSRVTHANNSLGSIGKEHAGVFVKGTVMPLKCAVVLL